MAQVCEEHGIPYAKRIAADNGVTENTATGGGTRVGAGVKRGTHEEV
jgi:hypothetical protein